MTTDMSVPNSPYLLKVAGTPGYSADTTLRIMMPSETSGTPPLKGGKKGKKVKK